MSHWIPNEVSCLATENKQTCDILSPARVFTCKDITVFQENDAKLFFLFKVYILS